MFDQAFFDAHEWDWISRPRILISFKRCLVFQGYLGESRTSIELQKIIERNIFGSASYLNSISLDVETFIGLKYSGNQ